ncbi:hypothetical protein B484DRAFT_457635 [Ochromonadaceae sp. CCMP2298]|nr:hypothetical protein B484DRAFT_457635 [Ochromonadaceae sp. CCMP2298]
MLSIALRILTQLVRTPHVINVTSSQRGFATDKETYDVDAAGKALHRLQAKYIYYKQSRKEVRKIDGEPVEARAEGNALSGPQAMSSRQRAGFERWVRLVAKISLDEDYAELRGILNLQDALHQEAPATKRLWPTKKCSLYKGAVCRHDLNEAHKICSRRCQARRAKRERR